MSDKKVTARLLPQTTFSNTNLVMSHCAHDNSISKSGREAGTQKAWRITFPPCQQLLRRAAHPDRIYSIFSKQRLLSAAEE
jgi:hypothetical protein